MFVLNTIDLLLKSVSVRMLPFVPNSLNVEAIVSKMTFDTKCRAESSVMQISALTCLAKSCASTRIY